MTYSLHFSLPGLPRMTNHGSGKSTHWRTVQRDAKLWKSAVALIVGAKRPPAPLQKARLTLTRHSSVSPDPDGLVSGFKRVIDGLVESGVLANDRYENIGMPDYRWVKAKVRQGKIEVRVDEVKPHD